MKSEPITPARLAFNAEGLPWSPDFDDLYHPAVGALAQAEHVFLRGNQLPARWAGRERFTVLETGFGLGNNFLATWAAWRLDARRCERLAFISVEKHPLSGDDLARVHATSPLRPLADQLVAAWPLATPNLHLLDFEDGRVQLLLAFGDVTPMLGELQASVDAVYLDGFAPARNPAMWTRDVFKRIARLAGPGCTAATWSAAHAVREGLGREGFAVELAPGSGGKREITVREITVARYAPRHLPALPAAFGPAASGPREALILGGGLAGCAAAWALARQGWASTVLDRQPAPAMETSGNPGGLMHGIFNAPDSLHARWFRAAALHTARWAGPAVLAGRVAGRLDGLLRLDAALDEPAALHRAEQACQRVGLPDAYVRPLSQAQACAAAHRHVPHGGWWYGGAGWLAPRDWCAELLGRCDDLVTWRGAAAVARVQRAGSRWQALNAAGQVLAEAPVLVLAHALGARDRDGVPGVWPTGAPCPALTATRGQTTQWPHACIALPRPLSGRGYALGPTSDAPGGLLLGATSQPDDLDPSLRPADHQHNLQRAVQLGVLPACAAQLDDHALRQLSGRVGWRATTADRLPVIGPPVDTAALADAHQRRHRLDALRHHPRLHAADHGLYVFTGLASRGLTSAALGARLLAAWITGAPFPVENGLRDALDPARFDTGPRL